ncbi:hypothetical protein Pcinc_019035 [Petrolisthes cinctipes]|uniref:Uncharacterized protein n=1 Tax=Petrolisthes cinctipes TaxID=88211 RepID=A0AAE1FQT7_PETCI|nr:hypothetical protein Pcinc_019035 [Petrolisthes cinctipes]
MSQDNTQNALECVSCHLPYDTKQRLPSTSSTCFHTSCSTCLRHLALQAGNGGGEVVEEVVEEEVKRGEERTWPGEIKVEEDNGSIPGGRVIQCPWCQAEVNTDTFYTDKLILTKVKQKRLDDLPVIEELIISDLTSNPSAPPPPPPTTQQYNENIKDLIDFLDGPEAQHYLEPTPQSKQPLPQPSPYPEPTTPSKHPQPSPYPEPTTPLKHPQPSPYPEPTTPLKHPQPSPYPEPTTPSKHPQPLPPLQLVGLQLPVGQAEWPPSQPNQEYQPQLQGTPVIGWTQPLPHGSGSIDSADGLFHHKHSSHASESVPMDSSTSSSNKSDSSGSCNPKSSRRHHRRSSSDSSSNSSNDKSHHKSSHHHKPHHHKSSHHHKSHHHKSHHKSHRHKSSSHSDSS